MVKHLSSQKLSETLSLSKCTTSGDYRGPFWLYDYTRGMNLSMGANNPQDAFVEALTYYQERLLETEKELSELKEKVNNFIEQFKDNEDE